MTRMMELKDEAAAGEKRNLREESRLSTRARLLSAAVSSLIENGVARTTTVEVQRRAGVSRGALLHHFPSHADLLSATVEELVQRNGCSVARFRAKFKDVPDPVERAIQTLAATVTQPSYMAELELWAVARTDPALREALVAAERFARQESKRVVPEIFADVCDRPGYAPVLAITHEFLRGLAISGALHRNPARRKKLIDQWVWAAKLLLEQDCPESR